MLSLKGISLTSTSQTQLTLHLLRMCNYETALCFVLARERAIFCVELTFLLTPSTPLLSATVADAGVNTKRSEVSRRYVHRRGYFAGRTPRSRNCPRGLPWHTSEIRRHYHCNIKDAVRFALFGVWGSTSQRRTLSQYRATIILDCVTSLFRSTRLPGAPTTELPDVALRSLH
jgi:hypothetical protein